MMNVDVVPKRGGTICRQWRCPEKTQESSVLGVGDAAAARRRSPVRRATRGVGGGAGNDGNGRGNTGGSGEKDGGAGSERRGGSFQGPRLPAETWDFLALAVVFGAVVATLVLSGAGMARASVALWRPVGVSAEASAVASNAGKAPSALSVNGLEQCPPVEVTASRTNPPSTSRPTGRPLAFPGPRRGADSRIGAGLPPWVVGIQTESRWEQWLKQWMRMPGPWGR